MVLSSVIEICHCKPLLFFESISSSLYIYIIISKRDTISRQATITVKIIFYHVVSPQYACTPR